MFIEGVRNRALHSIHRTLWIRDTSESAIIYVIPNLRH